jgi:transposase-like protein
MDLRRRRSNFTREQRLAIIEEYEQGTLTGAEIAQKYGFKSPSLIFNWRERLLNPRPRLRNPKKSSTFAPEIMPQVADSEPMKKKTPEELEAEVKRLTKELEWAQLQNKALNTLIDIAEEQGIRIRKKSGAKR